VSKTSETYEIGSSKITVRIGDLLESDADVIVSSDDNQLSMGGGLSRAISRAAGPAYEAEVREEARRLGNLTLGRVVPTSAGSLKYKKIFHAISRINGQPNTPDLAATEKVIERSVRDSITLLDLMEVRRIAFPAIGTGYAKHLPVDVATAFSRVLTDLLGDGKRNLEVEIVLSKEAFVGDVSFRQFFQQFSERAKWKDKVVRDHTVFMVHGIRTAGDWMESVGRILHAADLSVNPVPVGYKFFDVFSFLFPFPFIRNRLITRIGKELVRVHGLDTTKKLSIIAHSFGTFLVANALKRNPAVKVNCIVLCGSVVPFDFDWQKLDPQLRDIDPNYPGFRVLNDCGWRDIWPVFAETITWGFGSTGRFGFQSGLAKDRYHNLKHSDFFAEQFVKDFWMPVIVEGRIVERKELRPKSSWLLQVLTRFHVKYLLLAGGACGAWRLLAR
jgi:O-acetyl-ADP-ribose deacetylase (regulator of RNase III)